MNKKTILFFGELPPKTVHGISLSSQRILNFLSVEFKIFTVEDKSCFGGLFNKIFGFITIFFHILFFYDKKVDVFYLNAPMSKLGLIKALILVRIISSLKPKTKIVSHLHRGDFTDFIKSSSNKCLFKYFSNIIDLIIVLSEKSAEELELSNLINKRKVKVLYNSVEVLSLNTPFKENINTFTSDYYCLCNYLESKGIHNLVSVVNKLHVKVDFNGTISDVKYMNLLNESNIYNVCSFYSVISGIEKEEKIKNSKALILPSLNEGMPLVLLESLAQGTPVICYDIGFISDYLGSNYPGLVTTHTNEALLDKIKWMESLTSDEYLKLRYQSYNLFWDNFSSDKINKLALQLFNEI